MDLTEQIYMGNTPRGGLRTRADRMGSRRALPQTNGLFEFDSRAPGYVSESERFHGSIETDIRARKQQRLSHEAEVVARRAAELQAREAAHQRSEQTAFEREQRRIEAARDPRRPSANRSNYPAVDIVTHEYTADDGAKRMRYEDAARDWRAERRRQNIYKCSNVGYDILTGEARAPQLPPAPQPQQFGVF